MSTRVTTIDAIGVVHRQSPLLDLSQLETSDYFIHRDEDLANKPSLRNSLRTSDHDGRTEDNGDLRQDRKESQDQTPPLPSPAGSNKDDLRSPRHIVQQLTVSKLPETSRTSSPSHSKASSLISDKNSLDPSNNQAQSLHQLQQGSAVDHTPLQQQGQRSDASKSEAATTGYASIDVLSKDDNISPPTVPPGSATKVPVTKSATTATTTKDTTHTTTTTTTTTTTSPTSPVAPLPKNVVALKKSSSSSDPNHESHSPNFRSRLTRLFRPSPKVDSSSPSLSSSSPNPRQRHGATAAAAGVRRQPSQLQRQGRPPGLRTQFQSESSPEPSTSPLSLALTLPLSLPLLLSDQEEHEDKKERQTSPGSADRKQGLFNMTQDTQERDRASLTSGVPLQISFAEKQEGLLTMRYQNGKGGEALRDGEMEGWRDGGMNGEK
ncbi:hypothetical protein BGZ65_007380, partial [Modicella reniformis]